MTLKFPASCFSWDWDSTYSDKMLHQRGKSSRIPKLSGWLENNPHLNDSGNVVDRTTLQQICLGVGIIMGDAHLIQFSEDGEFGPAPKYIATSPWAGPEYGMVHDYVHQLREDLLSAVKSPRCVIKVVDIESWWVNLIF